MVKLKLLDVFGYLSRRASKQSRFVASSNFSARWKYFHISNLASEAASFASHTSTKRKQRRFSVDDFKRTKEKEILQTIGAKNGCGCYVGF